MLWFIKLGKYRRNIQLSEVNRKKSLCNLQLLAITNILLLCQVVMQQDKTKIKLLQSHKHACNNTDNEEKLLDSCSVDTSIVPVLIRMTLRRHCEVRSHKTAQCQLHTFWCYCVPLHSLVGKLHQHQICCTESDSCSTAKTD